MDKIYKAQKIIAEKFPGEKRAIVVDAIRKIADINKTSKTESNLSSREWEELVKLLSND